MSDINLESAEFSFTPLKGIDLSTCISGGMSANLLDFEGRNHRKPSGH